MIERDRDRETETETETERGGGAQNNSLKEQCKLRPISKETTTNNVSACVETTEATGLELFFFSVSSYSSSVMLCY